MFYAGGQIIVKSVDQYGNPTVDVSDVFMSIFVIFFAASNAGHATAHAPDMGKAKAASKRIFTFIENPSKINAVAQENDSNQIRLTDTLGKIEFKNVWFRYPT